MSGKVYRIDDPRGAGEAEDPVSSGAAWEDSPDAPPAGRSDDHQALLDQGLRLNRAFIKINDPRVREAIIALVAEAAMLRPSDALRLVSEPISLREAPAQRRPRK